VNAWYRLWELFTSIGLLAPRLRWAGGILTTGAMLAAILSHMTWLGYSIQVITDSLSAWHW